MFFSLHSPAPKLFGKLSPHLLEFRKKIYQSRPAVPKLLPGGHLAIILNLGLTKTKKCCECSSILRVILKEFLEKHLRRARSVLPKPLVYRFAAWTRCQRDDKFDQIT